MKLSTRSRYGMRLMLDLALNSNKGSLFLKDIAREENISEKYLSLIIIPLKSAGLVSSTRGAHGGYALAKAPSEISLREIISILEGGTCLVDCVNDPSNCPRSDTCVTRDFWAILNNKISQTLDSYTLEDLVRMSKEKKNMTFMYQI